MGWLTETADGGLILSLHVQPKARRTEFCGLHGDAMKLRLAAAPVDGKANAALLAFLADFCDLPKAAVELIGGATSRAKRVRLAPVSAEALARLHRLC
ncbi:MAG: DUF167 domain-containing protein [Zoogloeaceae bacterium]|nr:DUF167 domain-containing protein [Rhodocyclaceae bacterium]MCP5235330.1 DUF167 domain-containing protein [Zoogloeaceae bacterium]